jgi:hypothetical protein
VKSMLFVRMIGLASLAATLLAIGAPWRSV